MKVCGRNHCDCRGVGAAEYSTLPLPWMPHFQVADVAASAASAIAVGGKELMHGKDDQGQSQWAVLADHNGAAFGVVPVVPGESDTRQLKKRLGCIARLSLTVPDALSSRDFYQRVVGWNAKSFETSEGNVARFEMQIDKETAAADICQVRKDQDGIPSVWLIHLPVDDLVESLRRVGERGGDVIREFAEAKCAIVRDPVGVYLALQAG